MKTVWFQEGQSYKPTSHASPSQFCRSGKIIVPSENRYNADSHLSFKDLQADHPSHPCSISLRIKHSKTDQGPQGETVILGRTDDDLCPVAVLSNYLALRATVQVPCLDGKMELL